MTIVIIIIIMIIIMIIIIIICYSLLYIHVYIHITNAGRPKLVGVSILLCLCSVLSKELGITVLAVNMIYDYLVLQKVSNKYS